MVEAQALDDIPLCVALAVAQALAEAEVQADTPLWVLEEAQARAEARAGDAETSLPFLSEVPFGTRRDGKRCRIAGTRLGALPATT